MLAVLIAAGQLESAICDATFADGDRADQRAALLRQLSIDVAREYLAALDGPQNPAWDVAAAVLERGLDRHGVRRLLEAYVRASGDEQAADRLPGYLLAYAAFRGGYAVMARDACGDTEDAARFGRIAAAYREHLRRLIPSAP
ncbi:MAG TPA: hypothetical protein VL484_16530 [Vicinamibacterales bacterium]|nr:hypothetical protein [Vicinamibacterales bacterium]